MQESNRPKVEHYRTGSYREQNVATSRRGRFLYVITSLDVGGTERHLAQLTPPLARQGREISIYCLYRKGVQADDLERSGIEVIGPPFERPVDAARGFTDYVRHAAILLKLLGQLIYRRPDVVHFFLPSAYILGAPLALITGIRVRIMSRRSLNKYQLKWRNAPRIERRLHRHMTTLLGNSQAVVDELVEQEGCEPDKVHLIYNGVDATRFSNLPPKAELRAQLEIPERAFVAVIVANLIAYKGHEDLLHALAQVRDRLPEPWLLLCVGRDDGSLASLEAIASQEGLTQNIRFLGRRDDVPELLTASDLGILCSHEEGFANAILEGMAAGLPMVVSDVGGNAEAMVDGETGLVVPPKDTVALGAAIAELATDRKRARAMGAAARKRAHEHFNLEHCISRYEALYDELLLPFEKRSRDVSPPHSEHGAPVPADLIADFYRKYSNNPELRNSEGGVPVSSPEIPGKERVEGPLSDPKVSVIVPVYNDAALVPRAIKSVLNQSFASFELLIVDDASTDGLDKTLSTFDDPRIRVLRHKRNKGAAAARNTGIAEARGHYIAFLDSDDCWLPNKLDRQVQFMESSHGKVRMSCTAYENISPYHPEGEIRFTPAILTEQDFHAGCRVSPGTTLMAEKSLFAEVGPMNEVIPRLEDWEWLLRATRITNLEALSDILSIVDYSSAEGISYASVRTSTRMLRSSYLEIAGPLPRKERRIFFGTLENELAAAAYRSRRFGLAFWHLFRSLTHWPHLSREYFSRLTSAVLADSKKLIRPGPRNFDRKARSQ